MDHTSVFPLFLGVPNKRYAWVWPSATIPHLVCGSQGPGVRPGSLLASLSLISSQSFITFGAPEAAAFVHPASPETLL